MVATRRKLRCLRQDKLMINVHRVKLGRKDTATSTFAVGAIAMEPSPSVTGIDGIIGNGISDAFV